MENLVPETPINNLWDKALWTTLCKKAKKEATYWFLEEPTKFAGVPSGGFRRVLPRRLGRRNIRTESCPKRIPRQRSLGRSIARSIRPDLTGTSLRHRTRAISPTGPPSPTRQRLEPQKPEEQRDPDHVSSCRIYQEPTWWRAPPIESGIIPQFRCHIEAAKDTGNEEIGGVQRRKGSRRGLGLRSAYGDSKDGDWRGGEGRW